MKGKVNLFGVENVKYKVKYILGHVSYMELNQATISELTTLSGIGESIAEDIVNYRNKNGKFKKKEDIKNVPGIGESKYSKIKDKITV